MFRYPSRTLKNVHLTLFNHSNEYDYFAIARLLCAFTKHCPIIRCLYSPHFLSPSLCCSAEAPSPMDRTSILYPKAVMSTIGK